MSTTFRVALPIVAMPWGYQALNRCRAAHPGGERSLVVIRDAGSDFSRGRAEMWYCRGAFLIPPAVACWQPGSSKPFGRVPRRTGGSMLSSIGLATIVCFAIGVAIILALTMKAGAARTEGTIARVLYETEHPGERR